MAMDGDNPPSSFSSACGLSRRDLGPLQRAACAEIALGPQEGMGRWLLREAQIPITGLCKLLSGPCPIL